MKKVLTLLFLIIVAFQGKAQFTNNLWQGSTGQLTGQKGGLGTGYGLQFLNSFTDTASANVGISGQLIKNIPYFLISVQDSLFIRNGAATQWIKINGGSGGGTISLSAIGASPNANGATLSGSTFNLQPASASFGGVVTTGTQTFAGAKTFTSDATVNTLTVGLGGGSVSSNTAVGVNSFVNNTTGSFNTAVGYYSGYRRKTGQGNVSLGSFSQYYDSVSTGSTAIGYQALYRNDGNFNVAVGEQALQGNTTGTEQTAVGTTALYNNSTGNYNTALGHGAMQGSLTGSHNTAIGRFSASGLSSGDYNTYLGDSTGRGIVTGSNNTILGARIIGLASGLSNNIILADGQGNIRMQFNSSGNPNLSAVPSGVGTKALRIDGSGNVTYADTTIGSGGGSPNTSIGSGYKIAVNGTNDVKSLSGGFGVILDSATTGQVGAKADTSSGKLATKTDLITKWSTGGDAGTTPSTNFVGTTDAVGLMFKANNVRSGYIDLSHTSTSFGYQTLISGSLSGTNNTAFGLQALTANTSGQRNIAIGHHAGNSITTGSQNTVIGAMDVSGDPVLSTGSLNTYLGYNTAKFNNGTNNTAIGVAALSGFSGVQTGSNNTAIGYESLFSMQAGTTSSGLGYRSGYSTTSGINNIFLGQQSGYWNTTQSERVFVNSIQRANFGADTTASIIYGAQDATAANQRLYANAKFYTPYSTNNTSQNQLVGRVSGTGENGYVTLGSGLELYNGELQSAGVENVKNRTGQLYKGGTIYFFGDSYTYGSGASTPAKRWTSLVSTAMGATEVNNGVAGTTMEKRVPIDFMASPNMVDDTVNIPYKNKDIKLLVISFGLNDMGQTAAAYTTANFITDGTSVLNNATAKGWLANEILLIPPYWIGQAGYNVYATITGNAAPTVARHESFVAATQTLSQNFGTMYVNIYTDQKNNDTTLISGDNIHPTDEGYAFIAADILQYLGAVQTPLSLTTVATPNNVAFQHVTNVTNVGTIWTTSSAGLYGNTGLSDTTFVGNRRIIMDGTSFGSFYGFNATNVQTPFAGMEVAMLLSNTDLYVNDNGVFSGSPVATISNSDLISIVRNGSTFKVQSSSNNGLTWTDKYTFGYTSSATMYIVTDICGTSCTHGSYAHGTLDNPTISDLTGSSYQDIEGSLWFSKGIGAGVDAGKAYINPTTGAVRLGSYGAGTFTGTPTKNLQVDATGNIIEGAVVAGSQWITTGSDIYYSTGNVGIGAAPTAGYSLDISGSGYVNSRVKTSSSSSGASIILTDPNETWLVGARSDVASGTFAITNNSVGHLFKISQAGNITLPILAATGTRMVEASSTGVLSATQIVTSSTYTPTLTNTTNVSSSTPIVCHYIRVGNQVTVTGSVTLTPTTGTVATVLGISLPIASNFGATTDAAGVGNTIGTANSGFIIEANSTSDVGELKFIATTGAITLFFTFTYTVI